jgi:hypothetical protein
MNNENDLTRIKGTASGGFSSPVLLVPIGMPRNKFEFFRIFVELFVVVMNAPGSRLESLGSKEIFPNINHMSLCS